MGRNVFVLYIVVYVHYVNNFRCAAVDLDPTNPEIGMMRVSFTSVFHETIIS